MKYVYRLLFALGIAATATAFAGPSLENEILRAEWDSGRGALVSVRDKKTGKEWIDPAVKTPAYEILLAGQKSAVTANKAMKISVRQRNEKSIEVEGTHEGFTVTCEYRLEEATPWVLGNISVRGAAPFKIAEVRFPVVVLRLPFSGTGAEDRLLWPECDGSLLCDPSTNNPLRKCSYPGNASLQMMAAYDPAAGLVFATRDSEAWTKSFQTRRNGKGLELSIVHTPPQTPVKEWRLPYQVAVAGLKPVAGLGSVTWEAAAELYRAWALGQPWCRETAERRVASGDIPKWLTEPTMILTMSLRGEMPDKTKGNRLPMYADQVRRWSKLMGIPITCLITSWEKHDTWVAPDYFPPFGGEKAFVETTGKLRAEGHKTMVFLSGLQWTLQKKVETKEINTEAEFDRVGRASAISDAKGEASIKGFAEKDTGRSATICSATPLAREMLLGASARCGALGIDCVQVDQIVGGGMKECLHPAHAHPPGGGTYCREALYQIFGDIRKEGRSKNAAFAFSLEEPGEYYLPVLDTYHSRDLHQGRWPRSGAGVVGVPLFTHVYHDYMAGYGSEGCYVSERPATNTLYQIGMNLVCGKMPAVALWGRWCEPEKVDARQVKLLRAHLALMRGEAGEYLNYGRRVATPPLDVPTLKLALVEKDGKKRTQTVPSVLHGTWALRDGREGTVFACIGDVPVTFHYEGQELTLAPGEALFRKGARR